MSYHISDEGKRLEAEVSNFEDAIKSLRTAGVYQTGHEILNDIGQALNRVGCVLHNIGSVLASLKSDDVQTLERALTKLRALQQSFPDNYHVLVERALAPYLIAMEIRVAELQPAAPAAVEA